MSKVYLIWTNIKYATTNTILNWCNDILTTFKYSIFFKTQYTLVTKRLNTSTTIKSAVDYQKFTNSTARTYVTKTTNILNWSQLLRLLLTASTSYLKITFNYVYSMITFFVLWCKISAKQTFNNGFIYVKCLIVMFFIDALLTDDEPLWEPVEWSLIQYWLIFIFLFSWIAENLITSRYGSYTGRDKRVWFAWYKFFWIVELYYAVTLGLAALFVIVPFYHELSYVTPLIVSWWDWYSRTFFLKFMWLYTIILLLANYLQMTLAQFHWKKSLIIVILINLFFAYLIYGHFFITFFAYFTDANWYSQTRLVDYIQLSHEPNKWSWGTSKRDHFSYHSSKTVFWYKNDGPFAGAMLFFNIFMFLTLFMVHIFWLALTRRIFATSEITFTYTTFCVSALRQFLYGFNLLYILVFFSFLVMYWRMPLEFTWINVNESWMLIFWDLLCEYYNYLKTNL